MARLWDVKSGELLGTFKGHLCSLKSVAFTPEEKCKVSSEQNSYYIGEITYFLEIRHVFLYTVWLLSSYLSFWKASPVFLPILKFCLLFNSCVLYWGQRWEYYGLGYQMQQERFLFKYLITAKLKSFYGHRQTVFFFNSDKFQTLLTVWRFPTDGYYRQVKQISGAHNKAETNPTAKAKKRRSSTRGMAPSVVSVFNDWPFIFSPKYCHVERAALKMHVVFAG